MKARSHRYRMAIILARWADHAKTRREMMRHSVADAEAYDQFGKLMYHMAVMVKPILGMTPPRIGSFKPSEVMRLAGLGKHFRKTGEEYIYDMHKLMTMSSADYLDEWFETECLKATMSASGIIGTFLGPRSPGTAYVLLHHYMGEIDGNFRAWGFQRGGMGGVSEAIAGAARAAGCGNSTRSVPSRKSLIRNGTVHRRCLENGDELHATDRGFQSGSEAHIPETD